MINKCFYCGQVKDVQVVTSSRTGGGKTVTRIFSCARCIEEGKPSRRP
jgi:hypothetical protein